MNDTDPITDMTIRDLDAKLDRIREELRLELRNYVDERFVTRLDFDTRMNRLVLDVVREVSGTLHAMVSDAMREVAVETVHTFVEGAEFPKRIHEVLDARRAQDRKDRVEDVRNAIGRVGRLVAFVNPIITMVMGLIAIWAIFVR